MNLFMNIFCNLIRGASNEIPQQHKSAFFHHKYINESIKSMNKKNVKALQEFVREKENLLKNLLD